MISNISGANRLGFQAYIQLTHCLGSDIVNPAKLKTRQITEFDEKTGHNGFVMISEAQVGGTCRDLFATNGKSKNELDGLFARYELEGRYRDHNYDMRINGTADSEIKKKLIEERDLPFDTIHLYSTSKSELKYKRDANNMKINTMVVDGEEVKVPSK